MRRVLLMVVSGVALTVTSAQAAEPNTTPLEQVAGVAASAVAGKPVQVRCHDEPNWTALGYPAAILGFAFLGGATAELSPLTCAWLDDLWVGSPPQCSRVVYDTVAVKRSEWVNVRKRVRVRVAGKLVWRTRLVPVKKVGTRYVDRERREPTSCATERERAVAALTVAHEAFHLTGVKDEASAECYGMQRISLVTRHLGLPSVDANWLADLAWAGYDRRAGTPYWSPDCRKDGPLDLSPGDGVFP